MIADCIYSISRLPLGIRTVSYRGVVFVRHQPNLTPELMNRLAKKLGELSGKPQSSKLHIHPLSKEFSELGEFKGEKIDSEADDQGRQISFKSEKSNFASVGWVSDCLLLRLLAFVGFLGASGSLGPKGSRALKVLRSYSPLDSYELKDL